MSTASLGTVATTESYDVAKLVVPPSLMNETYNSVKSLVEDVANRLEDINTTVSNLQLSWVSDSATLMNEFTQRWEDAVQSLFGTTGDPNLGAFNRLLEGLNSATGNYDAAENWVMTAFEKLADGLMGSGGPSGPTSVTNTGTATNPSTFITEIF